MRAWKYLVLIGGIAGVAGFFLPLFMFTSDAHRLDISVSAYQIVSGIDAASQLVDTATPITANHADAERALALVNSELARYRGAVIAVFAPAVALALLGALAGVRRRMGRIAGLVAIVLGLVNAGIWLVFFDVALDEPDVRVSLGYGLHLLLVAGIFGALAGLGALLAPDRGNADER